jgi:hypothetical protein
MDKLLVNGKSIKNFKRSILSRVHNSKRKNKYFAFLLYDLTNANIIKILKDIDFYNAIDKISNKNLIIYTFHIPEIRETSHRNYSLLNQIVNLKTDNLDRINSFVKKLFDIENYKTPFLVFFNVKDGRISDSFAIELKEVKLQESFEELRNALISIMETLSKGLNLSKEDEILFKSIERKVTYLKVYRSIKVGSKYVDNIISIFSLF